MISGELMSRCCISVVKVGITLATAWCQNVFVVRIFCKYTAPLAQELEQDYNLKLTAGFTKVFTLMSLLLYFTFHR